MTYEKHSQFIQSVIKLTFNHFTYRVSTNNNNNKRTYPTCKSYLLSFRFGQ